MRYSFSDAEPFFITDVFRPLTDSEQAFNAVHAPNLKAIGGGWYKLTDIKMATHYIHALTLRGYMSYAEALFTRSTLPFGEPFGYGTFAREANIVDTSFAWPYIDKDGLVFDATKAIPNPVQYGLLDHQLGVELVPEGHVAVTALWKEQADDSIAEKSRADFKFKTRRRNLKLMKNAGTDLNTVEVQDGYAGAG
ncbi:hypothetical protein MKEN_00863600 [Mycena kentingensis (nom. inval.)]|nr:hypothetical protein MKEN_00863600 [Mycena kentingensis (nom. inval.)]